MNKYISIGFSIAVAPAILLAFGNWTQSSDTVIVSEWALFNVGMPIGALLVTVGLLATSNKQVKVLLNPKKIPLSCLVSEYMIWGLSLAVSYAVITTSVKATAFDPSDQILLNIIISLQILMGAALLRVFLSFFDREFMVGLGKKIAMTAFLFILFFGLTLYSDKLSHRWWQGYKNAPVGLHKLLSR